jgi:hypothetical protein
MEKQSSIVDQNQGSGYHREVSVAQCSIVIRYEAKLPFISAIFTNLAV